MDQTVLLIWAGSIGLMLPVVAYYRARAVR